ncbi:MAG TPA: LysR family transcriptional regulator [Beijerinckiaceae bacterium]|nr:LysR family transcriptional regulator [Beijerinckiaceae bacterium]
MARPPHPPERPEPSWDDLRVFLAVVAHGSLMGAAAALRQSQATVARRVRALEERLGVPLFARGPNSLGLTEAGFAVLEAAAPMAEAAEAIPGIAAAYRAGPDAPVRITATASVSLFLSRHAVELAEAAAPTQITLIPTRRRLDLASEAEIGLRMRRLPEGGALYARKVGRFAFALYESRTRPSDAVIAPPEDPDLSRQAAYVARIAQGRRVAARIGETPIRYQAAKAGLGAAFLPCWLGDSDPDLVRLADPPEDLIEDLFLVVHERSRRRPAVTRVAEALAALLRRHAPALAGG